MNLKLIIYLSHSKGAALLHQSKLVFCRPFQNFLCENSAPKYFFLSIGQDFILDLGEICHIEKQLSGQMDKLIIQVTQINDTKF